MLVEIVNLEDVCVLRLKGPLHVSTDVSYLHDQADEIKSKDYRKVVADLTEAAYIDSTALGFLVNLYTSVTRNPDARFAMGGANERIQYVFKLTRLNTVIPLFHDYPSALEWVRGTKRAHLQ